MTKVSEIARAIGQDYDDMKFGVILAYMRVIYVKQMKTNMTTCTSIEHVFLKKIHKHKQLKMKRLIILHIWFCFVLGFIWFFFFFHVLNIVISYFTT